MIVPITITLNATADIPAISGGKVPVTVPGTDMPGDNVYVYEITESDIEIIGQYISVIGIMVNNSDFPASYSFSGDQGSLAAGDTISFSGLPAKASVTKINFALI